jgi:hypothetical protein
VLQAVGCTVRLGPAEAPAETENDRLIKMVHNFVRKQSVFYGAIRSSALERATGLYVHITRIQDEIEAELRAVDDTLFEQMVFPERALFPLRWILQNAIRVYAQHDPDAQAVVREKVLHVLFPREVAQRVERRWFEGRVDDIRDARRDERLDLAEQLAERVIAENYQEIMAFYAATLRDYFTAQHISPEAFEWLLEGVTDSRNAIVTAPPDVDPASVWADDEFVIDVERGQAVAMRAADAVSS